MSVTTRAPEKWSASADYAGAQTNATVKAAPAAGLQHIVEWIVISNGAVAGNVTLLDGSGGSVVFEAYLPINGSIAISGTHIELTAATLLAFTSTSATTHAVNCGGYTELA